MATHSSTLAWKIPWMEEPGGLQGHGVAKSWPRLSNFSFTGLCFKLVWERIGYEIFSTFDAELRLNWQRTLPQRSYFFLNNLTFFSPS